MLAFVIGLAMIFALTSNDIISYITKMISMLMSGLFVCSILGRFWLRFNWQGALTALLSGMLGRTLISRPNVERLVNNPTIGLEKVDPSQVDTQIETLMKTIKVVQTGGNNLFAISYRDVDGERARRLVEGLVALFMESGVDSKRKDSAEASRFIDEQITAY